MTTKMWDFNPDQTRLFRELHFNAQNQSYFKSVQIRPITEQRRNWERPDETTPLKWTRKNGEFENLLLDRRTKREPVHQYITLHTISRLTALSCGLSDHKDGYMTYPSGGALYPVQLYLSLNNTPHILYRYNPYTHELEHKYEVDRKKLSRTIISTELRNFPVYLFMVTDYSLVSEKYGELAYKLVLQESGHIAQNVSLVCEYLRLNSVCLGGYYDQEFFNAVPELADAFDLIYTMVIG